ncbi:hypothetical protein EUTSA_v10011139mg [Eutrema salsugineum]|uniref:Terpene synthase metal-binding domain-containing protein n=1 Tax=Eutrema salsugineum TaxID=72664 RepID=V4LPC6_EUTSA|nr:hypothetical protein EUTSA_v10011139mg [Eutrema salsugineum]
MMVLAKAYLQEPKWLNEGYVATFDEQWWRENGVYSAGYLALLTMSLLGTVDEGTIGMLEWLNTFPPLLVTSSLIGRFCDDIGSSEFEHKRKHQYGVSWEKAKEEIKVMALDLWKTLNQELVVRPHHLPFPVLMRFLNLSRVIEVFYKKTDMFTYPELMKDYVVSLFLDNISV